MADRRLDRIHLTVRPAFEPGQPDAHIPLLPEQLVALAAAGPMG